MSREIQEKISKTDSQNMLDVFKDKSMSLKVHEYHTVKLQKILTLCAHHSDVVGVLARRQQRMSTLDIYQLTFYAMYYCL